MSYLHVEHPVYAGGRAVGRSVGRSDEWGGEEIWPLRMRTGKKPCGSAAAARAQVCVRLCVEYVWVCVCVYQSTDTPSFKIAADAPTKSTHTAAARVIGRVRFFISLSSLQLFSFFSSLTGRDQCRPCSSYYYYKYRYTHIYIYIIYNIHLNIIIITLSSSVVGAVRALVCVFFPGLLNRAIINTGCTRSTAFSIRPAFRPTTLQRLFAFLYYQYLYRPARV